MQMFNAEHLQEKWAPLLDHSGLGEIKDSHRRMVTAVLLENQERTLREEREFLSEGPTNSANGVGGSGGYGGGASSTVAGFDPVLISLIRRAMPNLVAYDLAGVQPMNGPTGLIFAMRSKYSTQGGDEAFFNEADTRFSAQNAANTLGQTGIGTTASTVGQNNPSVLNDNPATAYGLSGGMATGDSENLGTTGGGAFNEMAFSIEKVTVTAKSRALKAEYSLELAQDLKAIHGLNAEAELANILSTEILAEINREVIRTIYNVAKPGAQANVATNGTFDLDVDSNGRWSVEKFKGLIFQIERDANAIAQETRRGKGNMILCSADVASALTMAGVLDYTPALNANLNVDDTGNTFAGILQGKYKVYIDPYSANVSPNQYYVVGYKGSSPYDAGIFYCPYVPLQMVRAVGENTFQPKIGFKTRYGIVANPFAKGFSSSNPGAIEVNTNAYYRRVKVTNLM
jgi:FlaG/FlaF family flagellin (archaellin)